MAKKKPIKRLRTGAWERSFSLARLGLGASARAAGSALSGLLDNEVAAAARKRAHWLAQATSFVAEIGELKGSLMKAGQMLSIYGEHFLPPEINTLLRTLQNDSPPVDFGEIRKAIVKSIGKEKIEQLEIDETPCGAASLGQVHKAVIKKTGEVLALKVQYPGVERAIDGDIKSLRKLLSLIEWIPNTPATDEILEEIRSMLKREVNYSLELEMLQFYGEKLAGDSRYIVPKVYPEFSGKRVLAMSFESGVKIEGPEVAAYSQERKNNLALAVLDLYFRELFEWRRVQTDPHFGNFHVRGDAIVLYDFGAVRDFSEDFMKRYTAMLRSTFHENREAFEGAAQDLNVIERSDPQELKDLFYNLCLMITEPFLEPQPYNWKSNDLVKRVSDISWDIVKKFPLRSPPREIVFLDRKMAGNFTLLAKLEAKINGRTLLAKYLD